MELSKQQIYEFEKATECYICRQRFIQSNVNVKNIRIYLESIQSILKICMNN